MAEDLADSDSGRLRDQLNTSLVRHGVVVTGLPFRALAEYDLRVADVAYVTRERWEQTKDEDYCLGAPDLTIEVPSLSNTAIEIDEKSALSLANGCREFWVVDPRLRQITAATPDGLTRAYRSVDSIPLTFAESQTLEVDSVFADR